MKQNIYNFLTPEPRTSQAGLDDVKSPFENEHNVHIIKSTLLCYISVSFDRHLQPCSHSTVKIQNSPVTPWKLPCACLLSIPSSHPLPLAATVQGFEIRVLPFLELRRDGILQQVLCGSWLSLRRVLLRLAAVVSCSSLLLQGPVILPHVGVPPLLCPLTCW